MRFLSILRACNKIKQSWLRRFFSLPTPSVVLGKKFQHARTGKNLSVTEVATALHFSERVVIALENGEIYENRMPSLLSPGYFRLAAVAYARFLDLDFLEIASLLPPPAPLISTYTTFIKKLSPLQQRPRKPHFKRGEKQLLYSLQDVKFFLWKIFKIIILVVALLYFWNLMRHLTRVLF